MRVEWLDPTGPPYDELVRLVQGVAATGGAVGWLDVPAVEEVRDWVDDLVRDGARTALVRDDQGVLRASGCWARPSAPVLARNAELRKVMVEPAARGQGLGGALVRALVEDARRAGVEVLTLDCRGNNHGALALYARVGFVTTGRRPDYIAVGEDRFDQVLLHLDLRDGPAGTRRHGGRPEGPGGSSARPLPKPGERPRIGSRT